MILVLMGAWPWLVADLISVDVGSGKCFLLDRKQAVTRLNDDISLLRSLTRIRTYMNGTFEEYLDAHCNQKWQLNLKINELFFSTVI